MRVSDDDRRRVVDELRRHCAAGRIDVDAFSARIERALAATTLEELDSIRADLPMLRIAEPAGRGDRGDASGGDGGVVSRALVPGRAAGERSRLPQARLTAAAIALITVVVVVAAVIAVLVGEWTWAVLLLAGWAAGMVQGRLGRRSAT